MEDSLLKSVFGDYSVVGSGEFDHLTADPRTAEKLFFLPTAVLDIILGDVGGAVQLASIDGLAGTESAKCGDEEVAEKPASARQPTVFLSSVTRQPQSFGVTYCGAMLLADISGFTKLSSEYCMLGRDGLDRLHSITNDYMNELCLCIQGHDGDIIKFAGDALICLFKEPSSTPLGRPLDQLDSKQRREALLLGSFKATACALQLKDKVVHGLTVHCAVSCGDFEIGCVGGHNGSWESIVLGSTVSLLSQCLDDAPSRCVCVTQGVVDVLKSAKDISLGVEEQEGEEGGAAEAEEEEEVLVEEVKADEPVTRRRKRRGPKPVEEIDEAANPDTAAATLTAEPEPTELLPEYYEMTFKRQRVRPGRNYIISKLRLRSEAQHRQVLFYGCDRVGKSQSLLGDIDELVDGFVPLPFAEAMRSDTVHILSELRDVTTLFIKLDDYEHGTYPLSRLDVIFRKYQTVLARSLGFNRQFLVDDKGCVAIALWGVPGASHLDNARRAVWTASSLRLLLAEGGVSTSMGITTGMVYCGVVGGHDRKEYAVVGSRVNIAARLMGKAHGEILVDRDTFTALSHDVQVLFEALEPMVVKGSSEPEEVQRYSSSDSFALASATELSELRDVLREPLVRQLNLLRGGDDKGLVGSIVKTLTGSVTRTTSSSGVMGDGSERPSFLLLHGNAGTGADEAARWLRDSCAEVNVQCACVRLNKEDKYRQYSGLAKLFRELVSPRDYDVLQRQCFIAHDLLNNVYPKYEDLETRQQVAHPAMRLALGISTPFFAKYRSITSAALEKWPLPPPPRLPHAVVREVMMKIFTYLLAQTPTALVLENIQFMDYLSFRVISEFTTLRVRVFVLVTKTSLLVDDRSALRRGAGVSVGISAGHVHSDYMKILARSEGVTVISLPFYTPAETGRHLQLALQRAAQGGTQGGKDVPGTPLSVEAREMAYVRQQCRAHLEDHQLRNNLSATLFEITRGNPFWVKTILSCISTSGPLVFLARTQGEPVPRSPLPVRPTAALEKVVPVDEAMQATSPQQQQRQEEGDQQQERTGSGTGDNRLSNFLLMSLGTLGPLEQSCLKLASVIGPSFSALLLQSIIPEQNRAQLSTTLEALCLAQWLRKQPDPSLSRCRRRRAGDEERTEERSTSRQTSRQTSANMSPLVATVAQYHFAHRLMQDTLYQALPASVRVTIHHTLARFIDDSFLPTAAEDAEAVGLSEMQSDPLLDSMVQEEEEAAGGGLQQGKALNSARARLRASYMECYRISGVHFALCKTEPRKALRYLCCYAEYAAAEAYNPDELSRVLATATTQCSSAYDCNCLLGIVSISIQAFVDNQVKVINVAKELRGGPLAGGHRGGIVQSFFCWLNPPEPVDRNENINELRQLLRLDAAVCKHFDTSLRPNLANLTQQASDEEEHLQSLNEQWRVHLVTHRLLDHARNSRSALRTGHDDDRGSFFASFAGKGQSVSMMSALGSRVNPLAEALVVRRSEQSVMALIERTVDEAGRIRSKPSYRDKAPTADGGCVIT